MTCKWLASIGLQPTVKENGSDISDGKWQSPFFLSASWPYGRAKVNEAKQRQLARLPRDWWKVKVERVENSKWGNAQHLTFATAIVRLTDCLCGTRQGRGTEILMLSLISGTSGVGSSKGTVWSPLATSDKHIRQHSTALTRAEEGRKSGGKHMWRVNFGLAFLSLGSEVKRLHWLASKKKVRNYCKLARKMLAHREMCCCCCPWCSIHCSLEGTPFPSSLSTSPKKWCSACAQQPQEGK